MKSCYQGLMELIDRFAEKAAIEQLRAAKQKVLQVYCSLCRDQDLLLDAVRRLDGLIRQRLLD
jgi:hypothetical protein